MGAVRNSRSPPIASVSIFVPDFLYHFRLTELVLVEYIIRQVPFAVILFVYFRFIGFKGAGCKLCEVGSLLTVDHRLADIKFGIGDYFSVDFIPDLVDGFEQGHLFALRGRRCGRFGRCGGPAAACQRERHNGYAGKGKEFASVHLFHGVLLSVCPLCFLGGSGFGILCTCSPLHLMLSL